MLFCVQTILCRSDISSHKQYISDAQYIGINIGIGRYLVFFNISVSVRLADISADGKKYVFCCYFTEIYTFVHNRLEVVSASSYQYHIFFYV